MSLSPLLSPLLFLLGLAILVVAIGSAIRIFMLPGTGPHLVSRVTMGFLQPLFGLVARLLPPGTARDFVAGLFAPVALLTVYAALMLLNLLGFAAFYGALGDRSPVRALLDSGLSVTTLGSPTLDNLPGTVLSIVAAVVGTTTSALLIGYLPTVHAAYLERQQSIAMLEAHLGVTDSGPAILVAYAHLPGIERLPEAWTEWIRWFAGIAESLHSLAGSLFLRSPGGRHSWVTTANAVLDAAALAAAALDPVHARGAARCVHAGARALAAAATFLALRLPSLGQGPAAISVTRGEFDSALAALAAAGLPITSDHDAAWAKFVPLRAAYEPAILAFCHFKRVALARWDVPADFPAAASDPEADLDDGAADAPLA